MEHWTDVRFTSEVEIIGVVLGDAVAVIAFSKKNHQIAKNENNCLYDPYVTPL